MRLVKDTRKDARKDKRKDKRKEEPIQESGSSEQHPVTAPQYEPA